MWLVFALRSAIFAGVTSILAKCGIQRTGSAVTAAIRTVVVPALSFPKRDPRFGNDFIFCLSPSKTWFNIVCYPVRIQKAGGKNVDLGIFRAGPHPGQPAQRDRRYRCCNVILKSFVARVRPCDVSTAVWLLVPRP